MRTIYMKRSLLIVLVSTTSLISVVYMIDYYLFQVPQQESDSTFHQVSSFLLKDHLDSNQIRKVVINAKDSDDDTNLLQSFNVITKCSVTLVLILCEDVQKEDTKNTYDMISTTTNITNMSKRTVGERIIRFRKSTKRKRKNSQEVPIAKNFLRQINQTLVLLKSVALQTHFGDDFPPSMKNCVKVVILGEKQEHFDTVKESVEKEWSSEFLERIHLEFFPVKYPKESEWMRKMFRPCATLRLFIPEILGTNYGQDGVVIYVDTDFIFLKSVQSLVTNFFSQDKISRNSKVVAGMAPCLFHYGDTSNKIPYFGYSGLNAGLMLMNLTRMTETLWTKKIRMVTSMFQHSIKLADQDILNIYFHFFPEELQLLSCDWNFRPFQCREGSYCEDSNLVDGISALHGNALSFMSSGPEPLFHTVFQAFLTNLRLDGNFSLESFVELLDAKLMEAEERSGKNNEIGSDCVQYGGFRTLVLNRLETTLRSLDLGMTSSDTEGEQKDFDFEIMTELALNHEPIVTNS